MLCGMKKLCSCHISQVLPRLKFQALFSSLRSTSAWILFPTTLTKLLSNVGSLWLIWGSTKVPYKAFVKWLLLLSTVDVGSWQPSWKHQNIPELFLAPSVVCFLWHKIKLIPVFLCSLWLDSSASVPRCAHWIVHGPSLPLVYSDHSDCVWSASPHYHDSYEFPYEKKC